MSPTHPRYSREDISQRGDAIYESDIRPSLKLEDDGKFVAVDADSGSYEIDEDELTASDRLLARRPNAQIWLVRIGSRCVRRYGPRPGGTLRRGLKFRVKRRNSFDFG